MSKILIYSGAGVSIHSLQHTRNAIRSLLPHQYDVQAISTVSLLTDPWQSTCALLIMPGGRDLPYCVDLNGEGNRKIKEYLKNGGKYLGLCAGAYYASSRVEFQVGTPLEVVGDRELGLFEGTCRGTVFGEFDYESEKGARVVQVDLDETSEPWKAICKDIGLDKTVNSWYNGGGFFVPKDSARQFVPLARYVLSHSEEHSIAGVFCKVGKGSAILWGIHPEYPLDSRPSGTNTPIKPTLPNQGDIPQHTLLLLSTLKLLGLTVPHINSKKYAEETLAAPPKLSPLYLTAVDNKTVEWMTSRLLTIFKKPLANETPEQKEANIKHQLERLSLSDVPNFELKDRHDIFVLYPSPDERLAEKVQISCDKAPGSWDVDQLHAKEKTIVSTSGSKYAIPASNLTPKFSLKDYYDELSLLKGGQEFGKVVLYGETVTSTQTMLDKNDRFLSLLPDGLICLATNQITGRGRSQNTWLSPPGCLQFSLVTRLSLQMASKIVFVQYLFGLAVVEGIRTRQGYEELEVRVKWPNDIYVYVNEVQDGVTFKVLKKIGGILVNSSFMNGVFTLVIGCGINTTNSSPTTSIAEVIKETYPNLPIIPQEILLASVITKFEEMWPVFVEKGFDPFTELYLKRWIHQNQKVTIESTNQLVKIVSITPDHGFLRTIPIKLNDDGSEMILQPSKTLLGRSKENYIDLQPDGNGFDMTRGLIVTK